MHKFVFLLIPFAAFGQARYDLLLKGGHVVDAKNHISAIRDVAIAHGRIAAVAPDIPVAQARKT
ncbi:MAG: amidohydrolase/deacetylase family metallohydrolase, partial [Bryobacteraceae bacterium]